MRVTLRTRRKVMAPLALSALCGLSLAGCASDSTQFTMPRWGRGEINGPSSAAMAGTPSRASSDRSMSDFMEGPREAGRRASESVRTAWHKASDSIAEAVSFEPGVEDSNDPTRLGTPVGPLDADLYVQAARVAVQNNQFDEAEAKYRQALSVDPNYRKALLGLARLSESQGDVTQAVTLYQQAIRANPQDAMAYNDLGLCYALHGRTSEGLTMLGRAVDIEPQNPRYRNNIAIVLVDLERYDEALAHLRSVHAPAHAHHNLACLLNARGKEEMASQHFAMAQQLGSSASAAPVQSGSVAQASTTLPVLAPATGPAQSAPVQSGAIQVGPAQPVQLTPSGSWQGYTPAPTSPASGSVRTAELNQQSSVEPRSEIRQVEFAYDERPLAASSPGDAGVDGSFFGSPSMTPPPQHLPPVR